MSLNKAGLLHQHSSTLSKKTSAITLDESPDHHFLLEESLHWSSILIDVRAYPGLVYPLGVFHPLSGLHACPLHGMGTCKFTCNARCNAVMD